MFEIASSLLFISNVMTALLLYRAYKLRKPVKVAKEVEAIQRAIRAFESQRSAILKIETINPDDVYLRNLGR